MKYKEMWT